MKRDTRNYGKRHPRFFKGGAVVDAEAAERRTGERATREDLEQERWNDIEKAGKGLPREYEQERNRDKSLIQKGDIHEYEIEEGSDEDQDLRDESERGA